MRTPQHALTVVWLLCVCVVVSAVGHTPHSTPKTSLTRVVSDFHVGSIWFQSAESQNALMTMLEGMAEPATPVTRLVLLGDIFDFWLIPMDVEPQPLRKVVLSDDILGFNLTRMVDTIRRIAENDVEIVCLTQGNHDIEMDASLAGFTFGDHVTFMKDTISLDGVVMHHGHQWDLFNRPDPRGIINYGYYVTRAAASTNHDSSTGSGNLIVQILLQLWNDQLLDPIIGEILDNHTFFKLVLGEIMNAVVPGGHWTKIQDMVYAGGDPFGSGASNFTVGQSVEWYTNLVDLIVSMEGYSKAEVAAMVKGAIGNFEYFVRRFPASVGVLGHTHQPMLVTYKRPVGFHHEGGASDREPIVYANSGAWVDNGTKTWVDISFEYSEKGVQKPTLVQLMTMPLPGYLLKQHWMYGPNVGLLHEHLVVSARTRRVSLNGGLPVTCLSPACSWELPAHRNSLTLLAILHKAGVLQVATEAEGLAPSSTRWGGMWLSVTSGKLLPPAEGMSASIIQLQYLPPPADQSLPVLELASWWSTEGATSWMRDQPSMMIGVSSGAQHMDQVPAGWICDWRWYGSGDGCDLMCGDAVVDPDCEEGRTTRVTSDV